LTCIHIISNIHVHMHTYIHTYIHKYQSGRRRLVLYHVAYFVAKFIAIMLNPSFGKTFPRLIINCGKQFLKNQEKSQIEYSEGQKISSAILLDRTQNLNAKDEIKQRQSTAIDDKWPNLLFFGADKVMQ